MNKNKLVISFSLIVFLASLCLTVNYAVGQNPPLVSPPANNTVAALGSVVMEILQIKIS